MTDRNKDLRSANQNANTVDRHFDHDHDGRDWNVDAEERSRLNVQPRISEVGMDGAARSGWDAGPRDIGGDGHLFSPFK